MKRAEKMRRGEKGRRDERTDKKGMSGEQKKENGVRERRENRSLFDVQEALLETPHRSSLLSNVMKMC